MIAATKVFNILATLLVVAALAAPFAAEYRAVAVAEALASTPDSPLTDDAEKFVAQHRASERGIALLNLDVFRSREWLAYYDGERQRRETDAQNLYKPLVDRIDSNWLVPDFGVRFDAAVGQAIDSQASNLTDDVAVYVTLIRECSGDTLRILPGFVVDAIAEAAPHLCELRGPAAG